MSLITRILPPNNKNSKLTFVEMDNNLYYLQSLGVSGLTFSANTLTITNPTGGTKSVIINTGVTFTGGTVSGATSFTNGLTANIISATTYQNLPIDISVTGGTYSAGTATFTNNTGGTFNVTGFLTGVTDTYVTGGTYSNGTATFTNNSGGTFNVSGFYTGDTTLITGATNVGTGITIFDSVVNRSLQINSITGDTLEKITTSLSNNTIQLDVNEQNLTLWDLVVQGNRLLNGNVSYISGLTFNVSPLEYLINGTIYDITSATTVTLNSGDSTYDRIDVIYADINGNTGVLEGTPSENPEKPIVDGFSQVEVTFVLVPANSIIPDINQVIVYNENLGPPNEWTFGSLGLQPTRIIGSSTDQAYTGSTSIRVSGVTGAFTTSFRLTGNTILDTNQYATLQFAIRNLSANTTTSQIRLRFLSTGGTQNGNTVFMNAAGSSGFVQYTSTNTSSWQLISIPLWRFYLTNTNVQVIEFSFNNPNARYYFDLIEFVAGTSSSPPSNSWTTIKGDGTTTITAPNPNATLTISGGTNISSSISGTSTVVLNLDNNISLNGVTANTVSATTYQNLPTDVRVTGGTYSNNTFTYTNNTGGTFNTSFNTLTGLTVNGNLNVTGNTNIGESLTANTISANTLNVNGVNITGDTYVTGLTFNTGNYNLTIGRNDGVTFTDSLSILAGDLSVTGGTYDIFTGDATFTNNTGGTFVVSGFLVGYTDLLVTGATYNNNTFTFKNSSGGTFDVSFNTVTGLTSTGTIQSSILSATTYQNLPDNVTGNYLPLSGGTVSGSTNFTNGLTANTISATTYQNLPTDVRVTGSTYSNNLFTYTNNTGGTFNVLFNTVTGLTVNGNLIVTGTTSSSSISATTYQNLPTDVRVTGGTYSNGTITFTNNTGGTFNVTGLVTGTTTTIGGEYLPLSGGTVTGQTIFNQGVTANTISATTYQNLPDNVTGNYLPLSGGTVTGQTIFNQGLTATTISATTYQNLPISGLTEGSYINISGSNGNYTISVTGLTQGLSGEYLALSGGTVSGGTQFTNGLTANTISATTYQNLPTDVRVTGATYSNNTFTYRNNTGGTFNVLFNTVTGLTSTGTISANTISANTISATTYQNLPVTADTFVTAFTYNSNTFTIGRNQGLSTLTATIGSVTGLTSTGTISSASLSSTTLTVNGVNITGDTFVTGGTYSAGTITFRNNQNTTFPVTGLTQPFTGGTVSGSTNFTNGLTANTISATTYQNLPVTADTFVTGFTYSNNTFTISRNQGLTPLTSSINVVTGLTVNGNLTVTGTTSSNTISATTYQNLPTDVRVTGATYSNNSFTYRNNTGGTFSVLFNTVTGLTSTGTISANTISATTYQNLPTDIRVTGATYTNNTFTHTNNTGGTYSVLFNTVTGLTVNGNLSVTGNTGLGTSSPSTKLQITANNNLNTANNVLRFEDTDTSAANDQFNGKIEFYTSDTTGPGVRSYIAGITDTAGDGKIIFGTALGSATSLTGGTTIGERMRIDENGYVGINENSPTYQFEVSSGTEVTDEIAAWIKNDNSKGVYIIPTAGSAGYNFNTISGDTVIITTQGEHLVVGAKDGAAFRFSGGSSSVNSGNTITTGNRIGIGTVFYNGVTQPSEALDINGSARFRAVGATAFFANLNITSDGTLTTATSDIRLKENIEPLNNSLEKLLQLTGVTFNWIGQEGKRIGFIAQDVEKVIPELVFTNENTEDKIKGIHMDNITSVLVESIKEQQQQIESLKTEIQDLKNRISNIGG
jgi:hypothetical protein